MDNPFKPRTTGAVQKPWAQSLKQRQEVEKNSSIPPYAHPALQNQGAYYQMSGPYRQSSEPLPAESQPLQESQPPQANQNLTVTGPSSLSYEKANPKRFVSEYRDLGRAHMPYNRADQQNSCPQYTAAGPTAPFYRPADKQQSRPQYPGPGLSYVPCAPMIPLQPYRQQAGPGPAKDTQPTAPGGFLRATMVAPGQYIPQGGGQHRSRSIKAKQLEDPFTSAKRGTPDGQGQGKKDPKDRGFLRSKIKPHADYCSGNDGDVSDCDEDDEKEKRCGQLDGEEFCRRRKAPESPSVLRKDRVDIARLTKRVAQLEADMAARERAHEKEIEECKWRAVDAVEDAVAGVGGIERGSQLWQDIVDDVHKKMGGRDWDSPNSDVDMS